MASFVQEFKQFAIKGNVMDLAVGVIVGGAFGKIVNSVVNDLVMPPIGAILQGVSFSDLKWILTTNPDGTPAATLAYGNFIQTMVEFLVVAGSVFLAIQAINRFRRKNEAPQPAGPVTPLPTKEEKLLGEIRDLLAVLAKKG